MRINALLSGIFLTVAAIGTNAAHAQTNVLFVFDASGSMNRDAGGESRIIAAKRAISETLRSMPPSARLGLMVYGHRRSRDCSDIELVSPIASEDAAALSRYVNALIPRGETPIAQALVSAGKSFAAFKGQSNRIVLVTDGIEECRGDPCAAAQTLAGLGVDLKVDVVGFTLNDAQRRLIQCVPDITGGRYYDAKDANGLTRAMAEVRQQAVQAPVQAPPPAPVEFNLLSPANGGHVVAAPDASWQRVISGKDADEIEVRGEIPAEAVFAFKDGRPATFGSFRLYIGATAAGNPAEVEVSASDAPSGPFRSLGIFKPQNMRLLATPYQRFEIAETTAKYVKVKFIASYGTVGVSRYRKVPQLQLIGELAQAVDAAPPPAAQDAGPVNLLLAANGGQVLAAPDISWQRVISGKDAELIEVKGDIPAEAIFAFKDERAATFRSFGLYIGATAAGNPAEVEIFAGDALSGPFRSLGSFKPQNMRMLASPYQRFEIPETTAKYLKVKFIASYGTVGVSRYRKVPQLQLLGTLN